MKELTKQNLSILFIALLWAGVFIIFINYLQPLRSEISTLRTEEKQKERIKETLETYHQQAESLVVFYGGAQNQINLLNNALPDKPQPEQVLSILNYLARNHQMSLGSLDFSFQEREKLGILEVKFNMIGRDYERFKEWLVALEQELRIMDIKRIDITTRNLVDQPGGRARRDNEIIFDFQITINAYYQPLVKPADNIDFN